MDKLRSRLSTRIGKEGFRTLLSRSLTLTVVQYPCLATLRVEHDGTLVGLSELEAGGSMQADGDYAVDDDMDGAVALISRLIGLLVTFIGEEITGNIVRAVWPGFAMDDESDEEKERP